MSLDSSTQVHSSWILENAKKKKKKTPANGTACSEKFFQGAEFRKVSEIMRKLEQQCAELLAWCTAVVF